ncbi:DoxX family protein [Rhodoferax sp. TBRC 17198]|uniref:DoxX family protein n=1 Tax=Rhodoferax potami TaxID=3068338 RepID=UPI0028BD6292|nr:DoxX family protein [Rhodoferax sp. TBRC 17198]MDT7524014.1 DoxX family protein [Rhodoferax sp. TBRC 17198]
MKSSVPVYFPRTRFAGWVAGERVVILAHGALDALQAPAALLARLYVAYVFFSSGLTKLRDWETTLALFMDEYHVPLLHPNVAAWLGTAGELVLPVLLVFGLAGRFAALGLSVVNVVAVWSLSEIAAAALQQHITWGVLLAALALYSCGAWSVDRWIYRRRLAGV